MNDVFEREWELYLKGGVRPAFCGVERKVWPKGFDRPVKVGEIRIFADMNRPFVALVTGERGKIGFRLVPVSPFTVPASVREILVGERVFQLWNVCVAARSFVERSWRVETLAAEDLADVVTALAAVPSGARSKDETAAAYERAFAVSGGDFGAWTASAARSRTGWWRSRASWGLAAMLMLCCGIGGLWYEEVLCERRMSEVMVKAARMEEYRKNLLKSADGDDADVLYEAEPEEAEVELAGAQAVDLGPIEFPECQSAPPCDSVACSVKPPALEKVVVIKSPVTMRTMVGSRNPGAIGMMTRGGATVCEILVGGPAADGERYAEFTENEFVSPKSEPLSTFGLDVDTSSYALMRSSINDQKRLPPKNSVRIEEFVNYFKFDYPQPKDGEPIAVGCELASCPWNAKHRLLRLGVQAKTVEEKNLPPCNLTFLIDVSGSMAWNHGLEMAKQGLKMLVGKLRDEDHVAIVTYANGTAVRLPSVSGREKRAIASVIDGLNAGGGTAGGAGIQLAYDEAKKNFDRKANNRVILLTDGDFNIGISSPKELEDFIAAKRESGVFLTVLGVGRGNFQDANMKKLANAGNGNYAFLDSVLEAKKVMLNEFGGTLLTVAKDVKVQIEFNPAEVEGYRLLGYENRRLQAKDFNDDRKDAGEIGSGHTMTAFYEIVPAGTDEQVGAVDPLKYQKRETAKSDELMTVKLRYKLPDAEKSVLREKAHTAAELMRKDPSEDFRFASAVAEFALLLKDSKHKGDASFAKLIERARNAKGEDREGLRAEFIRLAETAELLSEKTSLPPERIGCRHVDGCRFDDVQAERAVTKAIRELVAAQAADGSWGTNKITDTAWTVLAFMSHGEVPGGSCSKEFGETLIKGVEFLIDAADSATDDEIDLAACALLTARDMTRHPNACEAAVRLFRRMKTQKNQDPWRQLLRTEACWLAQRIARGDGARAAGEIATTADAMWPELMAWWKAFDAQGGEVAFKCRALMLDGDSSQAETWRLLDQMRGWKQDDGRPSTTALCATLNRYYACMKANCRPEDAVAWGEWNREMRRSLPAKLAKAEDVSGKALVILQLTVPYRYRRSPWSRPDTSSCETPQSPDVEVEVDL